MKSLYPRLAVTGIKKNRKLYLPYILSCIGMVMMSYIMQSLSYSPLLKQMKGGGSMEMILSLGKFVIAAFALIFLFYTNSFLVHRRYKEFGLYNILGMDKHGISRIVLWESLFTALAGLVCGVGLGILFSKFAELGLLRAVRGEVNYKFTVAPEAIIVTLQLFIVIFALITLKSLISVRKCKPLELLHSENAGETPPKGNILFAVAGVIILAVAYYLSVSIRSPLTALLLFFVAVIMVILATYILFITGSVALCRLLKKNKSYYYKKQHFVSVSSMAYRMRRNGAGLASICILSTMVLVMISSTSSLYFGEDETLRSRYPYENEISVFLSPDQMTDEVTCAVKAGYEAIFSENDFIPSKVCDYRYAESAGLLTGDKINTEVGFNSALISYDNVRALYFISLPDFNRIMGTEYSLESDEALLYPIRCSYRKDTLSINEINIKIAGVPDKCIDIGTANSVITPSFILVIPDFDIIEPLFDTYDYTGERILSCSYYYGYNTDAEPEKASEIFHYVKDSLQNTDEIKDEHGGYGYSAGCLSEERDDFFEGYGALFFIGIMLSIVFIFAATTIIYYKQISEGYEDMARFEIMQKVGMTKKDIKKSINSQIMTVFFLPLGFAVLHLAFAFPMVHKILMMFNLTNTPFLILVTVISVLVFAMFYVIIYKVTSNAYYNIVSDTENNNHR